MTTTDSLFSYAPSVVKSKLLDGLLPQVGRLLLAALFAVQARRATEQELQARGLDGSQVSLRLDRDYWYTSTTLLGPVCFPLFAYRDRNRWGSDAVCPVCHLAWFQPSTGSVAPPPPEPAHGSSACSRTSLLGWLVIPTHSSTTPGERLKEFEFLVSLGLVSALSTLLASVVAPWPFAIVPQWAVPFNEQADRTQVESRVPARRQPADMTT
jgi:hypothetical protein